MGDERRIQERDVEIFMRLAWDAMQHGANVSQTTVTKQQAEEFKPVDASEVDQLYRKLVEMSGNDTIKFH